MGMAMVGLKKDERITKDSRHLLLMRLNTALLKDAGRTRFLKALNAEGVPFQPGYVAPCHTAKVLTSPYVEKMTGRRPDLSGRTLPATERLSFVDGIWCYHTFFLGTKKDMKMAAEAFEKVYANIDELQAL